MMLFLIKSLKQKTIDNHIIRNFLFYGLGELILLVAGIYIAFQLENWREYENERIQEFKILTQIHAEFIENNKKLEVAKRHHEAAINSVSFILKKNKELTAEEVKTHFDDIFGFYTADLTLTSIEILINTGQLEVISDDTLRLQLAFFKDSHQDFNEEEINLKLAFHDRFVPFFLNNLLLTDLLEEGKITDADIYESVKFKNILYERRVLSKFVLYEMSQLMNYLNKSIILIENHLTQLKKE